MAQIGFGLQSIVCLFKTKICDGSQFSIALWRRSVPKLVNNNPLSFDAISEAFCYDPMTGYFTRRYDRGHFKKGTRIGGINCQGYEKIYFEGRQHSTSRLAWLYMTGEWPEFEIDHKNRNPSDNRWSNLREATPAEIRLTA